MFTWKRLLVFALLVIVVGFLAIQLLPFGRSHQNPPVQAEPAWDSPRTRELFFRACGDCHSNETVWPWYSNIAPVSWMIQDHVLEGRQQFNVSEWGRPENEAEEAAELVQNGEMPLPNYLPLHPEARLTEAEKQELIQGLLNTFGGDLEGGEGENEEGE
jgi:mono/diheme cytochrome c family protein